MVVTYKGALKASAQPKTVERESQPRSVRIRADDLEKLGYAAGCPGCAWHEDRIGPHRGHSATCREIIETALNETTEGKTRMNITKARQKGKYQKTTRGEGDDILHELL